MSISQSTMRPTALKSLETDLGTSISAGIWGKIVEMQKWVNESIPIGMICFFNESQQKSSGGGPVNLPENTWQICDGSLITDIESPMNGQNTPALTSSLRLKGGPNIGVTGGSTTQDLTHDHGNVSSVANCGNQPQGGAGLNICSIHNHVVFSESLVLTIDTPYWDLQPFIRIK